MQAPNNISISDQSKWFEQVNSGNLLPLEEITRKMKHHATLAQQNAENDLGAFLTKNPPIQTVVSEILNREKQRDFKIPSTLLGKKFKLQWNPDLNRSAWKTFNVEIPLEAHTINTGSFKGAVAYTQGVETRMEDACLTGVITVNDDEIPFFSIFDGFGGDGIAKECANQFKEIYTACLKQLLILTNNQTLNEQIIWYAFKKTSWQFDKNLKNFDAGATAIICLIKDRVVYAANVGDGCAFTLSNTKTITVLTKDHKPEDKVNQIVKKRGTVVNNLVSGRLAVARAIGIGGVPGVIPNCTLSMHELKDDDLLILYSKGATEAGIKSVPPALMGRFIADSMPIDGYDLLKNGRRLVYTIVEEGFFSNSDSPNLINTSQDKVTVMMINLCKKSVKNAKHISDQIKKTESL